MAFLASIDLEDERQLPSNIEFFNDISELRIRFEGKGYASSLPGNCLRGLWEYQQCIYKAVAACLYGAEDIRKLTREDLDTFELVFQVQGGSTDLSAKLGEFLGALSGFLSSMDSKDKFKTITAIALVVGLAWSATSIVDSREETKKEQIKATVQVSEESEKTRQFQIFERIITENPTVERFAHYSSEGARSIVKGAAGSNRITLGKSIFDRDEIEEVNQRSAKEAPTAEILNENFTILRSDTRSIGMTKFLVCREDGTEFTAFMQDSDFDENDLRAIWKAAKDRRTIRLEMNATKQRSAIRYAQITNILLVNGSVQ